MNPWDQAIVENSFGCEPISSFLEYCMLKTRTRSLGSVLPGFLPNFPSQIWVSDVAFVTFFCDKKFEASHLSHFWEECDALAYEKIFFSL